MALTEVNSLGIKDLEVKTADIAADAVTGAQIADDAIDSEHYTNASIDHAHLANDCVDGDNIADDAIDSEHITDGSVDIVHLANGTDGKIITWNASGVATVVGPGTDGQVLTSTGAGSPPAFEAAATGLTGVTTGSGNVTITDGNLIVASGHGIDFSATADGPQVSHASELFDDYEFGTWTVTCGNSVTLESGTDKATYIKIGRYVYLCGQLRVDSDNSNANFDITNLPFTTGASRGESSSAQYMSIAHYDLNVGSGTTGTKLVLTEHSTTGVLAALKEDAGYSRVAAESGKYVILSGGYITET